MGIHIMGKRSFTISTPALTGAAAEPQASDDTWHHDRRDETTRDRHDRRNDDYHDRREDDYHDTILRHMTCCSHLTDRRGRETAIQYWPSGITRDDITYDASPSTPHSGPRKQNHAYM